MFLCRPRTSTPVSASVAVSTTQVSVLWCRTQYIIYSGVYVIENGRLTDVYLKQCGVSQDQHVVPRRLFTSNLDVHITSYEYRGKGISAHYEYEVKVRLLLLVPFKHLLCSVIKVLRYHYSAVLLVVVTVDGRS